MSKIRLSALENRDFPAWRPPAFSRDSRGEIMGKKKGKRKILRGAMRRAKTDTLKLTLPISRKKDPSSPKGFLIPIYSSHSVESKRIKRFRKN